MKLILASISALVLSATNASADDAAYNTEFLLTTVVGSTVSTYSNSSARSVILPTGVNWACVSVPVTLSANGSVFTAGFSCVNANNDYISVTAACYSNNADFENHAMSLSKTSESVGTIQFRATCRTTREATSRPTIRG